MRSWCGDTAKWLAMLAKQWHQLCLAWPAWGGHGVIWGHFYPTSTSWGCHGAVQLLRGFAVALPLPGTTACAVLLALCVALSLQTATLLYFLLLPEQSPWPVFSIWLCGELGIAGVLETRLLRLWLQCRDQNSLQLKLRATRWQTEGTSEKGKNDPRLRCGLKENEGNGLCTYLGWTISNWGMIIPYKS